MKRGVDGTGGEARAGGWYHWTPVRAASTQSNETEQQGQEKEKKTGCRGRCFGLLSLPVLLRGSGFYGC